MLQGAELEPLWTPIPTGDTGSDPLFADTVSLRARIDRLSGGVVDSGTDDAREWSKLASDAEELLARCNHLGVAAVVVRGWSRTHGWEGFVQGLRLMHGLVTHCWEHLVPPLVDGEAYKRSSALEELGSLAPLLRRVPVCGRFSLNDFGSQEAGDPAAAAAFAAATPEARNLATEALAGLQALADAFHAKAGESLSWDTLHEVVRDADARMRALSKATGLPMGPQIEADAISTEETASPEADARAQPGPAGASGIPGAIRNRDDVIAVLDRLCAYYAAHEPSSPVPLLLNRARRLVNMSFLEAVQDLADQGVAQVQLVMGTPDE